MDESPRRIVAFDLARGVGLLGMIALHVAYHWADPAVLGGVAGTALGLVGGPLATPVFVLLLGASLAFSRRTDRRSLALRGLRYLAGALALNLVRGSLPLALARAAGVAPAGTELYSVWGLAVAVDVLALAGSTLLLAAALGPLLRRSPFVLGLALVVIIAAPLLRPLAPTDGLVGALAGLLVATGPTVYYPFLPWAGFALVGIAYGQAVRRGPDPRVIGRWGIAGVCLAAAGGALLAADPPVAMDVGWYWRLDPALALALTGVALAWIAVCERIVSRAGSLPPVRFLAGWGRITTRIYVAHWPIVAYGVGIVGFRTLDATATLGAIVVVAGVTHLFARAGRVGAQRRLTDRKAS